MLDFIPQTLARSSKITEPVRCNEVSYEGTQQIFARLGFFTKNWIERSKL